MKRLLSTLLIILAWIILPRTDLLAQRSVSYPQLVERSDRPNLYTERTTFPAQNSETLLLISFRMDYDLLPFRQQQEQEHSEQRFFSIAQANAEVYRGNMPVTREAWSDTARAISFEQTRSRTNHLEGAIGLRLRPDEYRVRMDFSNSDRPEQQRMPVSQRRDRDNRSSERTVEVPDFEQLKKGQLVLLAASQMKENHLELQLLNFGSSLLYGEDHELLFLLPKGRLRDSYQLQVHTLRRGSDRETAGDPIYNRTFSREEILYTDGFFLPENETMPRLQAVRTDDGYPFLLADLPNRRFPNSRFLITLQAEGDEDPLVSAVTGSRWVDMPVSLLNLDVAIDMLRFIMDDNQLRQMRRGSASEREERFRAFWKERDPTPDSEFNELMVEYYSRIDHAWEHYTTPERPGYESDQGRTWILYGEPRRIERRYPPGSATREIWYYPNRTLTFEATTGFGDFRLIREE